eukprot:m.209914 g.209914  ORF g.209914 m.209914 type:complete len:488 (+) comp18550_c1_seq1:153-1616(+)
MSEETAEVPPPSTTTTAITTTKRAGKKVHDPRSAAAQERWAVLNELQRRFRNHDPTLVDKILAEPDLMLAGRVALSIAAETGWTELVAQLLARGDDPNWQHPRKKSTALMSACMYGHTDVIRLLLDAGADPNITNYHRCTALMFACQAPCARDEMVDILVAAGALTEVVNTQRTTAAGFAQRNKHPELAARLKAMADTATHQRNRDRQDKSAHKLSFCDICHESLRTKTKVEYAIERIMADPDADASLKQFCQCAALTAMLDPCRKPRFHRVLELNHFRKEASETVAMLNSLQTMIQRLNCHPADVLIFDLCCGKSLTASIAALRYPQATVVAVDKLSEKFMPHYVDLPNVRFVEADLHQADGLVGEAIEDVKNRSERGECHAIIVGMHLCGLLSEKAADLFVTFPNINGLVLSPCCLPGANASTVVRRARAMRVDAYDLWCTYLLLSASTRARNQLQHPVRCNLRKDQAILSEKNSVITVQRCTWQ